MDGQVSLFDIGVRDITHKPPVDTKVIFFYEGKSYPAIVTAHCGGDFFYITFTGRQPSDDNPEVDNGGGWHIAVRGFKKDWDYLEESEG